MALDHADIGQTIRTALDVHDSNDAMDDHEDQEITYTVDEITSNDLSGTISSIPLPPRLLGNQMIRATKPSGEIALGEAIQLAYRHTMKSIARWDTTFDESPLHIVGLNPSFTPRDHQLGGTRMMNDIEREYAAVLLGDEMGLGKSAQLLLHVAYQKQLGQSAGPTLVVVDRMLMVQWQQEVKSTLDILKIKVAADWNGENEEGIISCNGLEVSELMGYDIVLTTYSWVVRDIKKLLAYQQFMQVNLWRQDAASNSLPIETFFPETADLLDEEGGEVNSGHALSQRPRSVIYSIQWDRVALDEAHKVKTQGSAEQEASFTALALRSSLLADGKRIYITATPYLNRYNELYAMLAFLQVKPFNDYGIFRRCFKVGKKGHTLDENLKATLAAHLLLTFSGLMIRRKIKDVCGVVDPVCIKVHVSLDKTAVIDYGEVQKPFDPKTEYATQDLIRHLVVEGLSKRPAGYRVESRDHQYARMSAAHPAAVRAQGRTQDVRSTKILPEWLHEMRRGDNCRSSKIDHTINIVVEFLNNPANTGDKIIVFCDFISPLECLAIRLEQVKVEYIKIHGQVLPEKTRHSNIASFKRDGGPRVMICTPQTMGLGHNLKIATKMILMTPNYVPGLEEQCIRRMVRLDSTKRCTVVRLFAQESIDLRVGDFQDHKIQQEVELFQEGLDMDIDFWRHMNLATYRNTIFHH